MDKLSTKLAELILSEFNKEEQITIIKQLADNPSFTVEILRKIVILRG